MITAQRRYIDRVKQFLLSLDREQIKLSTKVVKIKHLNAQRVALALEQLLKLEDPDTKSSTSDSEAPYMGNFYSTTVKKSSRRSRSKMEKVYSGVAVIMET